MSCALALESTAILVAIPTSFEEYLNLSQPGRNSDYLTCTDGKRLESLGAWSNKFQGLRQAFDQLEKTASNLNVAYFRNATTEDFKKATEKYAIVILIAHWKGRTFSKHDLIDPDMAKAALLRAEISIDPNLKSSDLVKALNEIVTGCGRLEINFDKSGHAFFDSPPPIPSINPNVWNLAGNTLLRETIARDMLDRVLKSTVLPGNMVEFWSSYASLGELNAMIPDCFNGALDLTMCSSQIAATFISAKRHRSFRILHSDKLVEPTGAALLVEEALRLSLGTNMHYAKVRMALSANIHKQLEGDGHEVSRNS